MEGGDRSQRELRGVGLSPRSDDLCYRDSLWRYCHRLSLPATPLVVNGLSTNRAASGNAGAAPASASHGSTPTTGNGWRRAGEPHDRLGRRGTTLRRHRERPLLVEVRRHRLAVGRAPKLRRGGRLARVERIAEWLGARPGLGSRRHARRAPARWQSAEPGSGGSAAHGGAGEQGPVGEQGGPGAQGGSRS